MTSFKEENFTVLTPVYFPQIQTPPSPDNQEIKEEESNLPSSNFHGFQTTFLSPTSIYPLRISQIMGFFPVSISRTNTEGKSQNGIIMKASSYISFPALISIFMILITILLIILHHIVDFKRLD